MLTRQEAEKIALKHLQKVPLLEPMDREDCDLYAVPSDAWCFNVSPHPVDPLNLRVGASWIICVCPKTGQVYDGCSGE